MAAELVLSPEAEWDITASYDWYEQRRAGSVMTMLITEGFLVVLSTDCWLESADHRRIPNARSYAGVGRIPPWPSSDLGENLALDEYVFGDVKDFDSNLILSFDDAKRIRGGLSQSGKEFEIIICCNGPESPILTAHAPNEVAHLGYDVAALSADYWSTVADFCPSQWANRFRVDLNKHGLISQRKPAEQYLAEYKARNEPDADSPFEVIYIVAVLL